MIPFHLTFFLFQAADIVALHEARCPNHDDQKRVIISTDGVSECRSNSNSLDVYGTKFYGCRQVFPHTIVRPVQKYKLSPKPYFKDFLRDMTDNRVVKIFSGDNPKRSMAKDVLNHASLFACDYCFTKGTSFAISDQQQEQKKKELAGQLNIIQQRITSLQDKEEEEETEEEISTLTSIKEGLISSLKNISKTKKQVVWPYSSRNGVPRTKEKMLEIANAIENNPQMSHEEKKGVTGKSPLHEVEDFDLVLDSPAEYLHSVCLGTGKRLVELTFNVGVSRPRVTKRKLTPPAIFNELISNIKYPGECSRRVRALDFSVWKGQEFRNLILFLFPIVVKCLEEKAKERTLWLLFAYIIRACTIPSEEFKLVDLDVIENCCDRYYFLYEALFGPRNCTYNTHVVFSHIMEMRRHGPLTLSSAFSFENFYGELRDSFAPGTVSPLKQIMQKVFLKRAVTKHSCNPKITFTAHETALECNNLIYTFKHRTYKFFKVTKVNQNDLTCVEIEKSSVKFKETPTLNWDRVGVFKKEKLLEEEIRISSNDICGKLVQVNDLLLTCPLAILDEK